jgi:hypothetical protein
MTGVLLAGPEDPMSPAAKWEYMKEVYPRYHQATKLEKKRILDEFCRTYRCHRKHAIRRLNGPIPSPQRPKRRGRRTYPDDVLAILKTIWEETSYPWSARLKVILQDWLPWIRQRFRLTPAQERQLLLISPAQMDRRLASYKRHLRKRIYGRTKPGTLLKHHIPIKTDSWNVHQPGYLEVDLVSHSGDSAEGEFAQTLNITDIHTTWDESITILGKGQKTVSDAMDTVQEALPFATLGIDSDNGSEFVNHHLFKRCQDRHIQFTRGRPYKKDDNAHIEQKNWTHVRKLYGYVRYDTPEAIDAMNDLNRNELRLFQNLFLPSVKLKEKIRQGSRLIRRYDTPKTPWRRVLASPYHDTLKVAQLKALRKTLNPFMLAQAIDQKLERICRLSATRKRQGSRPLPKILPASNRKPARVFTAPQTQRSPFVASSTLYANWANDRDNPLAKLRKSYAKEKFLAAS